MRHRSLFAAPLARPSALRRSAALGRASVGVLGLGLALSVLACDKGGEPSAPQETQSAANAASGSTASTASTVTGATASAAPSTGLAGEATGNTAPVLPDATKRSKPTADQLAARRKHDNAFRSALHKGRKASKAGDYAAAFPHFREAMTHRPNDPGLHGEWGWARFKAGELEDAGYTMQRALELSREPRQRGALLYNLGRIEEAKGEVARALAHYRESLVVRDNETVRARIEALSVKAPPPPGGDPSVDALCAKLLATSNACEADPPTCSCKALQSVTNPAADSPLKTAAVLVIDDTFLGEPSRDFLFAIESAGGGWQVADHLCENYEMDALSASGCKILDLAFTTVGAEAVSVAQLRYESYSQADDSRDHTYNSVVTQSSMLCSPVSGGVWCPQLETSAVYESSSWDDDAPAEVERSGLKLGVGAQGVTLRAGDGAGACSGNYRAAPYPFEAFAALECLYTERLR